MEKVIIKKVKIGEWLEYYKRQAVRNGNYKDGKRNGLKTDWHKNGRKESEETEE